MAGLDSESEETMPGRSLMNALHELKCDKEPKQRELKYAEFVADPFGEEAKRKKAELAKLRKIDEYTKNVKFHESQDNSKVMPGKTDLDEEYDSLVN